MALRTYALLVIGLAVSAVAWGAKTPPYKIPAKEALRTKRLTDELTQLRSRVLDVEQGLIDGIESKKKAEGAVLKIKLLINLQKQERLLGRKRLAELESTIEELEGRRDDLRNRITSQRAALWKLLVGLESSLRVVPEDPRGIVESEKFEAPKRRVFAHMAGRGLREIEVIKADLDDAHQLEARIHEERQHLVYLFQNLNEQESVLQANQKIQLDLLKQQHREREAQLQHYRSLKESEGQVEKLLTEFNARVELDKTMSAEREVNKVLFQGAFSKLKGQLGLPVAGGKIASTFGRNFDAKSGLFVFRKGVDVTAKANQEVRSVFAGKVAFSGELPNYGKVVIVDHGDHFYSLIGHLGVLSRKVGDAVTASEILGTSDPEGSPLYFEIRARSVAVNPKDWVVAAK